MADPRLYILIPIKPMAQAKRRLRTALPSEQRRQVVATLLRHVLDVVTSADLPKRVVVLAGDTEGAELARSLGAEVLTESGQWRLEIGGEEGTPTEQDDRANVPPLVESRLNRILADALAWTDEQGAVAALILPADLPLLSTADVEALWHLSQRAPTPHIVIASDRQEQGTNALLLCPPQVLTPSFGRGSFRRHVAQARRVGAAVRVYTSIGLAYDVDEPEDWRQIERAEGADRP